MRSIADGDVASNASATPRTRACRTWPSQNYQINCAWLALVLVAGDLLSWMKGLCLDGAFCVATPKRLRYSLLHTAGVIVCSARSRTLRVADGWPWAEDLVVAFGRLPGWATVT
jgi:hypothetical protein